VIFDANSKDRPQLFQFEQTGLTQSITNQPTETMKAPISVCAGVALTLALTPIHAQPTPSPSPSPAAADKASEKASDKADDLSQFKTADEAWAHIKKLEKGPEKRPESKEEYVAYLKQMQAAFSDFITRFSSDSRRFEAKLENAQLGYAIANMSGSSTNQQAIIDVCKEILAAKDVPEEPRRDARFFLLQDQLEKGADAKLQGEVEAFCKDYPKNPMGDTLKLTLAKKLTDPAKAHALLEELSKSGNEEVADSAKSELRLEQIKSKPLDLKFKAVDGSEVDIAKLKGKVVLVDFWATWCGPCMMEVPHVVEAYKKLHDKGFEIIGISLDQNKEAMLEVTKAKGMVWPQYFDGKGWKNEISSKFGIESIPAMWLVNKKGILVNTDAREDLEASIEKLLAE
jgi:thiol-disulfide isomerase/thioredoxin